VICPTRNKFYLFQQVCLLSCTFVHYSTSQDGRTLTLDDTQLQISNELRGKLQDILKAIKGIVAARKKGRGTGTARNADEMDAE